MQQLPSLNEPVNAGRRAGLRGSAALLAQMAAAAWVPLTARAQAGPTPVLQVGPEREFATPSAAARAAAGRGPVQVLIDAGDYAGDVAVWQDCEAQIEAQGGEVLLQADGQAAEGKAIWVVRRSRLRVQGVHFKGCRVPGGNGAGIRFESGELKLEQCRFTHHQMGLLTSNEPTARLIIERCEFSHSRRDGVAPAHNLYVGTIANFRLMGCYSHHADVGHLVKSRAAENHIRYNRLSDEADGRASYELDLPNGGLAVVVGNIIQQGPMTENPHLLSFGVEGLKWPRNELYLAHNTFIDERPSGGLPLRTPPAQALPMVAYNNLLSGFAGVDLGNAGFSPANGNFRVRRDDWLMHAAGAWQIKPSAGKRFTAVAMNRPHGITLEPSAEYRHPLQVQSISTAPGISGAHLSIVH